MVARREKGEQAEMLMLIAEAEGEEEKEDEVWGAPNRMGQTISTINLRC